ncbi:MAG: large repetitive protein [Verrucomicrobiota bacterium]|jgi:hypothetical protein
MQDQRFRRPYKSALLCLILAGIHLVATAQTTTKSFTNATPIDILELGDHSPYLASLYPSTIAVSGLPALITKVTATLRNFGHESPSDVDALLVGPGGESSILMSDAGGTFPVSNITLTFDAAQPPLPIGMLGSGAFAPRDFGISSLDSYPPPAPAGAHTASLSVFNNTNPNGIWRLYVLDDLDEGIGYIDDGWSITIVAQAACCDPAPVLGITRSGTNVVLRWSAAATGYTVVAKSALTSSLTWNPIVNPVTTTDGTNIVTVPATSGNRFFELRK